MTIPINNLINLPGAKPIILLGAFIVATALFNIPNSNVIEKNIKILLILFVSIFTISVLRSIDNLQVINYFRNEKLSIFRFIFSDYFKPLLYFFPIIVVVKYVQTKEDIEFIVYSITILLISLSLVLLFIIFFKIKSISNLSEINDYFANFFGMHRNDIANFYILGFPIVFARFIRKKTAVNLIIVILASAGIGFLFSRTAYFTLLISPIIYFAISNRKKWIPIVVVIMLCTLPFISTNIKDRAEKGLASKDANEIAANRIQLIWLPLIEEYKANPEKILFGNGRYSILLSKAASKNYILRVGHPHNMYLEAILDTGIFGFFIIISFFFFLLKNGYRNLELIKNNEMQEYQYGIFVSIIAYLIAGVTGRSFFPELANSLLWVILGLQIVIIKKKWNQ